MLAELRGVKAEGGWGVVCTEYCSIHPSSDDLPFPSCSLWDTGDIRAHAMMTEKVHEHGALAGVELWAGGSRSPNNFTRERSLGVESVRTGSVLNPLNGFPGQCRRMDRSDIRRLRKWHRDAALRARDADFDIVYVYASHGYLLSQFLSGATNNRADEYGGSLENRCRLVRELIEETREAVGDRCAVAVRYAVDDGLDKGGNPILNEYRDMFEMMAEMPDLWDINISSYSVEMGSSRFTGQGALEPYMHWVKSVTGKPVVTVGRFTSPDLMASWINKGFTDFIGAARPSIADPFLPQKIQSGQIDLIRECIGCNICYASDGLGVPIRCTQNPTIGEEWRRRWHPEKVPRTKKAGTVLVVGGGPAGLEAARVAGLRGYRVVLGEALRGLGGRITLESGLPGLQEWRRVLDYRVAQINTLGNVEIYLDSRMSVQDINDMEADHVCIATGSRWRCDAPAASPQPGCPGDSFPLHVCTVEQAASGEIPPGRILVYDEDHYYMASVLAEKFAADGRRVDYVTTGDRVSSWSAYTNEQHLAHLRLHEIGVPITTSHRLKALDGGGVVLENIYTRETMEKEATVLVPVTSREPDDELYQALLASQTGASRIPYSLHRIGDCDAPGIIAEAIFAGHRWARELDEEVDEANPARYDRSFFEP